MNKKLPIVSLIIIVLTITYLISRPKEQLYEAKWNDTSTLAITIDGEISTTFPTTNTYEGTVTCTTGTGSVSWNGSKWVLTTSGITKGGTKCNAKFNKLTFAETILVNSEVKTPTTIPGSAISASSEALLARTEDDYGTSYYFRGVVVKNYVEFANKCWRIVRIGGDNTVKLILHNDNTSNASNPCSSANNSTTAAFARYSGSTYTSEFNLGSNDNAFVGFMYGTAWYASTYEATHANTNKSTILTNLETWYNNNLKTYESVIDDNVFCNDKSNVTDTSYDPLSWGPKNGWSISGLGYADYLTYYAAAQRLVSSGNTPGGTGPSLKCSGELSKITSKIGLITADELAYAGYAYNLNNTGTYLQENATGDGWWSLSPFGVQPNLAFVLGIGNGSGDIYFIPVYANGGVRPYISLRSSTKISSGSGTSDDPYKIS